MEKTKQPAPKKKDSLIPGSTPSSAVSVSENISNSSTTIAKSSEFPESNDLLQISAKDDESVKNEVSVE